MRARRKILAKQSPSRFRWKSSRFHFSEAAATESLRRSQLVQPIAGQRNVGRRQCMSCVEKLDGHVRASSSQEIDQTLRFRGRNDWIVVSGSNPNATL